MSAVMSPNVLVFGKAVAAATKATKTTTNLMLVAMVSNRSVSSRTFYLPHRAKEKLSADGKKFLRL
jgi:hypothetical protein